MYQESLKTYHHNHTPKIDPRTNPNTAHITNPETGYAFCVTYVFCIVDLIVDISFFIFTYFYHLILLSILPFVKSVFQDLKNQNFSMFFQSLTVNVELILPFIFIKKILMIISFQ